MRSVDELRKELDADTEARRRQLQRSWAREAFPGTAGGAALTAAPVAEQSTRVPAVVASRARSGAHIHLFRSSDQSLSPGVTALAWTNYNPAHPKAHFPDVSFPASGINIAKTGYYDLQPEVRLEDPVTGAGLSITRTRAGVETTIWPLTSAPGGWVVPYRTDRFFGSVAKGIELIPDDTLTVYLAHAEPSAVDLAEATFTIELVDWSLQIVDWELVFAADNYGVTWDGSSWWTTDDTDDVTPALFEREPDGTILNSYPTFDTTTGLKRCRSLVWDGTWLYGVANDSYLFRIDTSDGSSTQHIDLSGWGTGHAGVGWDGTNLFVAEREVENEVREYTTGGTLADTHDFPSGRDIRDITWDGATWWGTQNGSSQIIRMDASFTEVLSIAGPASVNNGCHFRDGYLYVMTPSGLYRKAV